MSTHPVSHLICTYGPPKTGKSLDLGLSFCTGVFFCPSMSGLAPLQGFGGFVPEKKAQVNGLVPVLAWLREHKDDDKVSAVVIDDLALISDRQMVTWTRELGTSYARWNALNDTLLELFEIAATAPYCVAVNSHEVGPGENKSTWIPGGPKLASKPAGDALSKNAGLVLRTVVDPLSPAADSWPVIYSCDRTDSAFTTGDRQGFALPQNPLNLREILRAGGMELPRLPSLPWQEEMVQKLSNLLIEGKLDATKLQGAITHMTSKLKATDPAVRWTIRDARARAYLARHQNDLSAGLMSKVLEGIA